ncbi:MAG: diadenylate cyclase CdaA [Firmicutes bacterium]|nr:diadenylate cyclase CdaA [Bacillota bacterium]
MQEFFANAFSGFGIIDAIDIILVAVVVYFLLKMIMETRAQQIVKGILVLLATMIISETLELHVLNWICKGAVALGAFAILVVFQPELRRALEFMGRGKFVSSAFGQGDKEVDKKIVSEIVKAVDSMSSSKTGALIVFEKETSLEDISETGTILDATISEQLLGNIFYEGAPLHDGAVIISGGYIRSAGCVLPLTKNKDINKSLGTRHRAGIGITEHSDAISLIVSEETGIVSMAEDGKLIRFLDAKTVEKKLLSLYITEEDVGGTFAKIPGFKDLFKYMKQEEMRDEKIRRRIMHEANNDKMSGSSGEED